MRVTLTRSIGILLAWTAANVETTCLALLALKTLRESP